MTTPKKKILIVDDEAGFTRLVKLTMPRYEIREANDAREVIQIAKEFRPDVIILDVIMPWMDGGDLASLIRADATLRRIPIVFLTAIVSPKEMANGKRDIGGFPFLAKPVSSASLTQCIEQQLAA
jgi:CheY-like chemotaxis protein